MGGTEPAGPGGQPGAEVVTPPRLAVIMGRTADAGRVCRVDAPDRVLRIWAMLARAGDELHQANLRPGTVGRLQRQLDALIAELERSLSPALAGELHRLIGRKPGTDLTAGELRVEYATLLSWTIGLVIGILTELEMASAKPGSRSRRPGPAGPGTRPAAPEPAPSRPRLGVGRS